LHQATTGLSTEITYFVKFVTHTEAEYFY